MSLLKFIGVVAVVVVVAVAVVKVRRGRAPATDISTYEPEQIKVFKKPDATQLKKKLSSEQFSVTQNGGTETPYLNAYWNNHQQGLYVDVVSGEALFSSLDKFESGTGWPSFTQPAKGAEVVEKKDSALGMARTEVRSKFADSHLGHVFNDGPSDKGGLRYCINSAALQFVPLEKMDQSGYGQFLDPFVKAGLIKATARETAILAGGCFWGMEEIIRKIPGVIKTTAGYTGGNTTEPTYEEVCSGDTGHAESIEVVFDSAQLSYEALIDYFFRMHDPTTLNQQHNDQGTQYRSAIFYTSQAQQQTAQRVKMQLEKTGKFNRPITTEISPAKIFYSAEKYHQKYLVKNPGGYTCHVLRD